MAGNRDTPAMRQYDAFKQRHPDCVLFFRMGDFYEMFDQDAITVSRALGLTLTERSPGIKMAGVPYHSVETYLRRMIAQGFRVAVCDQVQDPREAKGIVERAVTRVVTPGTLVDDAMLDEAASNNLCALCFLDSGDTPEGRVGAAIVELSTGAFSIFDCAAGALVDELARRGVSEVLFAEPTGRSEAPTTPPRVARVLRALGVPGAPRPSWHFRSAEALEAILQHYQVASLAGFGLAPDDPAIPAAGAVLRYLRETQSIDDSHRPTSADFSSGASIALQTRPRSLAHIEPPRRDNPADYLQIDAASLRSLEIERTIRSTAPTSAGASGARSALDGSLLGVFASPGRSCRTSMGKRLLREWLCRPLADRPSIEARHACVATLVETAPMRDGLSEALSGVQDVSRIIARVGLWRATPRDLVALGRSLSRLESIAALLEGAPPFAPHREALLAVRDALSPLAADIERQCVEHPPAHLREGGLIRDGVDPALDESRHLQREGGQWLAEYQKTLVERHDLPSLKVGYNKVFGYYIELPDAQARRAPAEFTRKQTLKNAERYITPELKNYEEKVLTAGERAIARELELFSALCARAAAQTQATSRFAGAVAHLDALTCFAQIASHKRWVRPQISDAPILDIRQGRHPVLDELLGADFVPNDVALGLDSDDSRARLALITGPNMAGKSTFIRQVALLTILAQAGSFVPAESATIGLTDRVFTRIGADDALHAGQSTFMVEMVETASILHHATDRSLVILDEIGRGTSTLDGLALAWAIAERLSGAQGTVVRRKPLPTPRTLFATHYHELTALADHAPERIMNLQVAVREWGDQIIFLHRILPGRASRSYGIHVAKLAGLPVDVIKRADILLESLSVSHAAPGALRPAPTPTPPASQLSLFTEYLEHPAIVELKDMNLESLTPLQAFDTLRAIQQTLKTPNKA
jgi:DNA mismatch repair protein MutS